RGSITPIPAIMHHKQHEPGDTSRQKFQMHVLRNALCVSNMSTNSRPIPTGTTCNMSTNSRCVSATVLQCIASALWWCCASFGGSWRHTLCTQCIVHKQREQHQR